MVIALDPKQDIRYVLKEDRNSPKENQTVFILKTLTASELAQLEDSLTDYSLKRTSLDKSEITPNDIKMSLNSGSQTLKVLRMGIKGWENLKNKDGSLITFQKQGDVPREQNWNYLKSSWRRELADTITEQTHLSPDEAKN